MNITIIICTKDRPKEIVDILETVRIQKRIPNKLIIVDGSDIPVKEQVDLFGDLPIEYTTCRPPSLPKQRNVGISMLTDSDEWVGFLDDDLLLNESTFLEIENVIKTRQNSENLGGVGITNLNAPDIGKSFIRDLFYLDDFRGGVFTKSGCASVFRRSDDDQKVEWLSGGVSFWRKDILQTYKFDEWFDGIGYLEDVDFSYRVSRDYNLYLSSKATCTHESHDIAKEKLVKFGIWQLTSWWYFTRKVDDFKTLSVLWSMFGLFLNNLIMGILKPGSHRIRKAFGNFKGFFIILNGKGLEQRTFFKQ